MGIRKTPITAEGLHNYGRCMVVKRNGHLLN